MDYFSPVTAGEPLIIETTFDPSYVNWQPNRVYGWQIKNMAGEVLSYHYHMGRTPDEAIWDARQRFGAGHQYTIQDAQINI